MPVEALGLEDRPQDGIDHDDQKGRRMSGPHAEECQEMAYVGHGAPTRTVQLTFLVRVETSPARQVPAPRPLLCVNPAQPFRYRASLRAATPPTAGRARGTVQRLR